SFHGACTFIIHESEVRRLRYQNEQTGSDYAGRPRTDREDQAGHRTNLQIKRSPGSDALSRRRPRAREISSNCPLTGNLTFRTAETSGHSRNNPDARAKPQPWATVTEE